MNSSSRVRSVPRRPLPPAVFWLTVILLAALSLRGVALWLTRDVPPFLDERRYLSRAGALLDGQGFVGSYQSWVRHGDRLDVDLPQYPGAYQPPGHVVIPEAIAISPPVALGLKAASTLSMSLRVFSTP